MTAFWEGGRMHNVRRFLVPAVALASLAMTSALLAEGSSSEQGATEQAAPAGMPSLNIKPIDRTATRASVVLDRHCPTLVQPYTLSDNVASLGVVAGTVVARNLLSQLPAMLQGQGAATMNVGSADLLTTTKAAAKQLNWLPMDAEVLYGQRLHEQETNILRRDERLGKRLYPVADRMLKEILAGVGAPHEYQFRIFILKNDTRNALARPGGFLYVDKGLLDGPDTKKAWFALAHEIAHVLQRHETKELESAIIDSIAIREDVVKVVTTVRGNPAAIISYAKLEKDRFTRHYADQELQADSCAVRILAGALPDQKSVAETVNAFLKELPPPETDVPTIGPRSQAERVVQTGYELVTEPTRRHPNTQERQQNLRSIYSDVARQTPR
jgi:Zn-dependent protease with chaperone function